MPTLGQFAYPTIGVDDVLKYSKRLGEKSAGTVERSELARILGFEAKDTRFATVLSDLTLYGLLAAEGKRIKVTPFVRRLSRAKSGRRQRISLVLALWKVPVLNALARDFQGRLPAQGTSYVAILSRLTGVHVKEVVKHSDQIASLYEGFMRRIGVMRMPKRPGQD